MIKLIELLVAIRNQYKNKSNEFFKGFDECAELVRIHYTKNQEQYNLALINRDLKRKIDILGDNNSKLKSKYNNLLNEKLELESKLRRLSSFDNSPTPIVPIDEFREYSIKTINGESFTIVANISQQVLNAISKDFASKYIYSTTNECKFKLINFINTKNQVGIFASGNLKKAYKKNWKNENRQ
jgi:hypothetical protein